jgi:LL-diaminopimelate aminotransferase
MQRQFGVALNPLTEINHCIGSKTALSMIPACFINPGDVTLMTVPGIPRRRALILGTTAVRFIASPCLPKTISSPTSSRSRPTCWLAPNCWSSTIPTARRAKLRLVEFYEYVIDWAKTNKVVVVQDAAHILLSYEGEPLSFLSVPGAKDVGVEIHSMSKGFDMIGWRIGWVCGHERLVQAFADVKDNCDSGQFMAIQKAAAAALDDVAIPGQTRAKYQRRLEKLVAMLARCGFQVKMPGGTYFLYAAAPKSGGGLPFNNAEDASQYLITQHSIVTVPWDDAGSFLRFSVTYEAADEKAEDALMAEAEARLKKASFTF